MSRKTVSLNLNASNSKSCSVKEGTSRLNRILSTPYNLLEKSALFKRQYSDCIGYSIEGPLSNSTGLRMDVRPLRRAIECLGFAKVFEGMAECLVPDENKLNWALLTSKDKKIGRGEPGYLKMRPFVDRMYLICNKWCLTLSLRRAELRMRRRGLSFRTSSGELFGSREFIPFTLTMSSPRLEADLAKRPGTYLAKPARGSMGERMQLVRIRSDRVQEDLLNFLLRSEFQEMRRAEVILQQYIEQPLLIDKRKFDMRVYMLVINPKRGDGTAARPKQSGYFAFLHPGFVRLCSSPYDPNHTDIAVHLTNQSIQAKNVARFRRLKEVTTWYPDELNDYLNKRRRVQQHDWAKDVLYPKVGAILGYIASVYQFHLDDHECPSSTFRVLGVDMLVDEQLRVYLLEFNELPAWGRQTSVLGVIKPNLWREIICLTSEVTARYKMYAAVSENLQLVTRENFRVICTSDDPDLARRNVASLY